MIKVELKRVFKNKWYYIVILIGIALMCGHIYKVVIPAAMSLWKGNLGEKYTTASQIPNVFSCYSEISGHVYNAIFHVLLPLLCCIPYAGTFFSDRESGYIIQVLSRTKKKQYYHSKIIVQFITAGTITVIPMIFSFLVTAALLPLIVPEPGAGIYTIYEQVELADIFYRIPVMYIFICWIYEFIAYGLISCLSFVLCDLFNNSFMVILAPFILIFTESVIGNALDFMSINACLSPYALKQNVVLPLICTFVGILVLIALKARMKTRERDVIS